MLEGVAVSVIASGQPNISLFRGRSGAKVGADHRRPLGQRKLRTNDEANYKHSLGSLACPTSNTNRNNPALSACRQGGKVARAESTVQAMPILDRSVGEFEQRIMRTTPVTMMAVSDGDDDGYDSCDGGDDGVDDGGPWADAGDDDYDEGYDSDEDGDDEGGEGHVDGRWC